MQFRNNVGANLRLNPVDARLTTACDAKRALLGRCVARGAVGACGRRRMDAKGGYRQNFSMKNRWGCVNVL